MYHIDSLWWNGIIIAPKANVLSLKQITLRAIIHWPINNNSAEICNNVYERHFTGNMHVAKSIGSGQMLCNNWKFYLLQWIFSKFSMKLDWILNSYNEFTVDSSCYRKLVPDFSKRHVITIQCPLYSKI